MGVLPASSGKVALPPQFAKLMCQPQSPIIDFYPTDFQLDLNGKKYNWQAVVLLPFVDAKRLVKAIEPLERALTGDTKRMNGIGRTLVFVNKSHPLSRSILPMYKDKEERSANFVAMDQQLSQGINGFIAPYARAVVCGEPLLPPKTVPSLKAMPGGANVVCCSYKLPK